jgi:hypothetical protein
MCELELWGESLNQKFARREGMGEKGANLIASFLFLTSFSRPHAGLSAPKLAAKNSRGYCSISAVIALRLKDVTVSFK